MQATPRITFLLRFSLLAMSCAGPAVFAEPVARPFPQHTAYAAGAIKPTNISQSALDAETAAFYEAWKRKRLVAAKAAGEFYVAFDQPDAKSDRNVISVSEGHGYGMLITAFMAGYDPDAQRYYNGLYRFYKSHPSKNHPLLMSWRQVRNGSKKNDSATDGDLDIAYALLLADRQWGSAGEVNYRAEGKLLIEAIWSADINREILSVKLGDSITPDDAEYRDTRSSDLMPGHFRAFQRATARPQWQAMVGKSYALMAAVQATHSPQTGLLPDFICHVNTTPIPAKPKFLESKHDGEFYYNACRWPFRVAADYLISGDPQAKNVLEKINRWVRQKTGGQPAKITAGYSLAGKEIDQDHQMCFVAPLAVAAMVDAENQAWLNELSAFIINSEKEDNGYYDSTIKLLCLLALSGNWWSP